MSEKLNLTSAPTETVKDPEQVAEQFQVDPNDYPIFSRQTIKEFGGDTRSRINRLSPKIQETKLGIDETLGLYVRDTADLITVINGEGNAKAAINEQGEKVKNPPIDHVIYLDKSARPVSWLVNTFWGEFSDDQHPRPEHSYLSIDRGPWEKYVGLKTDPNDYIKDHGRLVENKDFDKKMEEPGNEPLLREFAARIRAIYLESGLTEDIDDLHKIPDPKGAPMSEETINEILASPTSLDGKNILIVDEVARSGLTLHIASRILKMAIPEANIYSTYFVPEVDNPEPRRIQRFTPIWYSHHTINGRGISDADSASAITDYEHFSDDEKIGAEKIGVHYRARVLGAFALGRPRALSQETGDIKSRDVMKEIQQMLKDYRGHKILMRIPQQYDQDEYADKLEDRGVVFMQPDESQAGRAPNVFLNIVKKQEGERERL